MNRIGGKKGDYYSTKLVSVLFGEAVLCNIMEVKIMSHEYVYEEDIIQLCF